MVSRNGTEHIQQKPDCIHGLLSKPNWSNNKSSGFTIVELVVVVGIIGVLASIALFGYGTYVEKARVVSAISEVNTIVKDIRIVQLDTPLPDSIPDNDVGTSFPDYAGFNDPWGNPYQYAHPPHRTKGGMLINTEFDVYSIGKDGITALDIGAAESLDDIIRAGDDEYVGRASGY